MPSSRKTAYDIDVTVEPVPGGMPTMAAATTAGPNSAPSVQAQKPSDQPGGSSDVAGLKKSGNKANQAKEKTKGRTKHAKSSSSSSSSSESSTNSESNDSGNEAALRSKSARHALDPWRYPFYTPSASYRQLDAVVGSHQYTIAGFSLARAMGCGSRLCSDLFEVAGQLFRLEVYPAGFTADMRRHVSVFLTTPGAVNPNHVMYEFAILDQSGRDKHIVASSGRLRRHLHNPLLVYSRGVVGAALRLAKARALQDKRKRYLPQDTLVIRATVHVLRGWSSAPTVHGHGTGRLGQAAPLVRPSTAVPLTMPGADLPSAPPHPGGPVPVPAAYAWQAGPYKPVHHQVQPAPGIVNLAPYVPPVPGVGWARSHAYAAPAEAPHVHAHAPHTMPHVHGGVPAAAT